MNSFTVFALIAATVSVTVVAADPTVHTHVLPHGAVCTHAPNSCGPGLACDGKASVKRCIIYKPAGMPCPSRENFWICQPGLACENDVCKIPRGGVCTENRDQCASGLSCDGKSTSKRCIIYKRPGMGCPARENFWICQRGLTCENDICKIPRGGVCTNDRAQCASGLSCDGKSTTQRCITYKRAGMGCPARENFWICEPGLTCERDVCKIPVGASCSSAPTQCVSGARCTRSGRGSTCTPVPRKLNESCDSTFKCERGLSCDGRCKLPKKAPCVRHPTLCVAGTVCSGVRLRKLCSPVRGPGDRCSQVGFLPCAPGLSCVKNACVRGAVPRGQRCHGTHEVCRAGLVCGGPEHHRICVKPMQKGEFCKGDPYWKCAAGLRCLHQYCEEY